jgi:hypothetical protein
MKQTSSTKTPVTSNDLTDVTSDDAPKLTQANFDTAQLRVAGRDVNRADLRRVIREELSH